MLLSARNVPFYLVERGLLSLDSIVDGQLVVSDASRRNRNFKVKRGAEPGFFVKQAARFDDISTQTVRRDARCYWLANNNAEFAALKPLLPSYHDFDVARSVLVVTLLENAETVYQRHLRLGAFPLDVAVSLARAVAHYHVSFRGLSASSGGAAFPRMLPWVLVSGDPMAFPPSLQTVPGRELLALSRARGIEQALAARRGEWRPETLINGDLKWDNFLVTSDPTVHGGIRIVDWEIADIGDPAWDVGSVLQSYFAHTLFTADSGSAPTFDPFVAGQPAMRAFWAEYVAAAAVVDAPGLLDRSIAFAAARLVQTAYESLYASTSVTPHAVRFLDVAARMIAAGPAAYRMVLGV